MNKPIQPYSSFQSTEAFDPSTYLINWATDQLPENKIGNILQHATQSLRAITSPIDSTIQMLVYPVLCFLQPLHQVYASIHNKESSKTIAGEVVKVPLHWASAAFLCVPVFTLANLGAIAICIIILPISLPFCALGNNTSSMDYFLRRKILRIVKENRFSVLPNYTPEKFKATGRNLQVPLLRKIYINEKYAEEYDNASREAQIEFENKITRVLDKHAFFQASRKLGA
jgi:hypothetical protein